MLNHNLKLSALAGLGLLALSGTASAAALSCITGNNTVTVDSSNACAATPGKNDQQVDEDTLVFNPGNLGPYDWTFLDKDNRSNNTLLDNEGNQIAGALEGWFLGSISDPGSQRNPIGMIAVGRQRLATGNALGEDRGIVQGGPDHDDGCRDRARARHFHLPASPLRPPRSPMRLGARNERGGPLPSAKRPGAKRGG